MLLIIGCQANYLLFTIFTIVHNVFVSQGLLFNSTKRESNSQLTEPFLVFQAAHSMLSVSTFISEDA
jgi:hypothetical protein